MANVLTPNISHGHSAMDAALVAPDTLASKATSVALQPYFKPKV